MSFLSDALTWMPTDLGNTAGETVTYYRGERAISIEATIGQTTFDQIETTGEIRSQMKAVDFMIRPADLSFNGLAAEPQKGDQIKRSTGEVFDVMTASGVAPWEWSDSRKSLYRIHTVRRNV